MRTCRFRIVLLLAVALAGCAAPRPPRPLHPSLQGADLPPLIPAERLFYPPSKTTGYKISPDGTRLAWIETYMDRPTIHFKVLGEARVRRIQAQGWRIGSFRWAQNSRHFIVHAPSRGKENYRLFAFDSREPRGEPLEITRFDGFMTSEKRAYLHTVPPADPEHVFVLMNDRDSTIYDYCRVGLNRREKEIVAVNPGDVTDWFADRDGRLVARERRDEDAGKRSLEVYAPATETWEERATLALDDDFTGLVLDGKGRTLWALSNHQRDRIALVRFDLDTGREEVVYAHPEVDVTTAYVSDVNYQALGVAVEPGYPEFIFLNEDQKAAYAPLLAAMAAAGFHDFRIVSSDREERLLVLRAYAATQSAYYLLDVARQELQLLDQGIGASEAAALAKTRPVALTSRDGLPLRGYLTCPKGVPERGLPMVLLVHGGPWGRDRYDFDPEVQFLANRGYAVLQINFRGSSGYGRAFLEAGWKEFGARMQEDLLDAVQWAVGQGIADPGRIAIMGNSYGGYAALVGLIDSPEVFACGIDGFGPSDLAALMRTRPRAWMLKKFFGDCEIAADLARMKEKSPLFKADQVVRPLLIMYGAEDQRVDLEQSTKMIQALEKAGKPVESHSFPDEGHWIVGPKNRLTYYRLIEDFLARHLGGRQGP